MAIGYGAATVYLDGRIDVWIRILAFVVAGFALYRLGTFMHEIVHMRHDEMNVFKFCWNVANGVQLVTPSHFYLNHIDHHNTGMYGTGNDGEYLPVGRGPVAHVLNYALTALLLPLWVGVRFMVITPLTLIPAVNRWAREHWSSFVTNFKYRRAVEPQHWMWTALEWWCCFRLWMVVVLIATGAAPWLRLPQIYALGAFVMSLNLARAMVSHRWHGDGERMSHHAQILDSTTMDGGWLTELICPLGMRYHALHHLFPGMPYHNLGIAHRRLMRALPATSPYRQTVCSGFWAAFVNGLRDARAEADSGGANSTRWYAARDRQLQDTA